jgi:S1-C subfamily serine protease
MMRSSIVTALCCAWLMLAASALPARAELKPEDLYSAVLPSVVTLDVENAAGRHFIGTAFLAAGDGLAVTAWHVVHDAQHVTARYSDGQQVESVGLVDKNEQLDVAVIKLGGSPRPQIKLLSAAPRIGSRIYVMGAPRGFDFSISEGLLSQVRTLDGVRYYQLSCPISPGDSGGPVLNERGEAVGVVSWRKADAENVGFAIPSSAIEGMNASLLPGAWGSGAETCATESKSFARAASATPASPNDYRALQQHLSRLAGQRVQVKVLVEGRETCFDVEVPRE